MRSGRFDWLTFFRARYIVYTTSGHTQGNIGIHCPLCGDADPSFHMGISLSGKGWNCWRNRSHRGVRPHRLIQALLKCSYFEAQRIVGDDAHTIGISDASLGAYLKAKLLGNKEIEEPKPIGFTPEIKPLYKCDRGTAKIFLRYLQEDRDYNLNECEDVCREYDLRYAMHGYFGYRIIFPTYMFGEMITWTGRSVGNGKGPRYLSLTSHKDKAVPGYPIALKPIKDCLWNFDYIVDHPARTLIVAEGPFDAMRLDYYGLSLDVRATCLFGKDISEEQLYLLEDIAPMFENRYLLLDPDASLDVLRVMDRIRVIGFEPLRIPAGFEDAAVMSKSEIRAFLRG